jgi:membrane protease YdiL (CAAX protease family)
MSAPVASHPSPPEHPERPESAAGRSLPPWPAWSPLAALAAAFAAATVVTLLFSAIGAIAGASASDPPASVSIPSLIVQDACFIGAALLFARLSGTAPRPWQFGLERVKRIGPAVALVVGGYLLFVAFSYGWLSLIGQSDQRDHVVEDLNADNSTLALACVTVVVTVCAPLAEEILFRGYTFGALRRFGLWPAAALTGLLFGLVHVFGSPIAFLVPLALLGATLCVIRERTGSLYPCLALHCANNSFAMASDQHWGWEIPIVLLGSLGLIALLVRVLLAFWPQAWDGRRPPRAAPAAA